MKIPKISLKTYTYILVNNSNYCLIKIVTINT